MESWGKEATKKTPGGKGSNFGLEILMKREARPRHKRG